MHCTISIYTAIVLYLFTNAHNLSSEYLNNYELYNVCESNHCLVTFCYWSIINSLQATVIKRSPSASNAWMQILKYAVNVKFQFVALPPSFFSHLCFFFAKFQHLICFKFFVDFPSQKINLLKKNTIKHWREGEVAIADCRERRNIGG